MNPETARGRALQAVREAFPEEYTEWAIALREARQRLAGERMIRECKAFAVSQEGVEFVKLRTKWEAGRQQREAERAERKAEIAALTAWHLKSIEHMAAENATCLPPADTEEAAVMALIDSEAVALDDAMRADDGIRAREILEWADEIARRIAIDDAEGRCL